MTSSSNGTQLDLFQPFYDRVLVRPVDELPEAPGGIELPATAREKPNEGLVLAVGPGGLQSGSILPRPIQARVGDHVLYGKFTGTEIVLDGETLRIMRDEEILGVLRQTEKEQKLLSYEAVLAKVLSDAEKEQKLLPYEAERPGLHRCADPEPTTSMAQGDR